MYFIFRFFLICVVLTRSGLAFSRSLSGTETLLQPDYLTISFPKTGFQNFSENNQIFSRCDIFPSEELDQQVAKGSHLAVLRQGPMGSGRHWRLAIGVWDTNKKKLVRGICLETSTVGWRTLQNYDLPLPWLEDFDRDGKDELIIWTSFPLFEGVSLSAYGMMAWVYRYDEFENSLSIDWTLSRKMAKRLEKSYRIPTKNSVFPYPDRLRHQARKILKSFYKQKQSLNSARLK